LLLLEKEIKGEKKKKRTPTKKNQR